MRRSARSSFDSLQKENQVQDARGSDSTPHFFMRIYKNSTIEPIQINQKTGKTELDKKIRGAAELYEKQFLREMTKAMRSTVKESELIPVSQGEKIFREQLDQQYADQWGDQGGIGLADLIEQKLREKLIK
jgi:Rod binding domain-containing protein